ncbi:Acetyltransferase [uncultured Pleomorphomonas sp.]|uniref:Acetyltransferase n=1 Tax=uncultured Pleomorphomonas sp. TaxID=442121 RepID=A0A212LFW0_9HYPH|nr:CatB-related O-acetyltransferase [uncultured Pleomorphomonas sp.]SCM76453.1 Acetyltransferase [uncultured Pleomorphomonas sp.]
MKASRVSEEKGVFLQGKISLNKNNPIMAECPIQLREAYYNIDFIGAFTYLGGSESRFRHIKSIGRFCSIAGGVIAGEIEHPTDHISPHPIFQGRWSTFGAWSEEYIKRNATALEVDRQSIPTSLGRRYNKIVIGNDVWIGEGAMIRRGVKIGDGAVIGAKSVVSDDVPPYAIVAGIPAKLIRYRFDEITIGRLMKLRWWEYGLSATEGCSMNLVSMALDTMERNIENGVAKLYKVELVDLRELF